MKKRLPILFTVLFLAFILLFSSCGGGEEKEEKEAEKTVYHTLSFDAGGGEFTDGNEHEFKAKESTALKDITKDLPEVIYEGHIFEGWFCDDKEYDETLLLTKDITYTAKWTKCYTVTFDACGGEFAEDAVTEFILREGQTLAEAVTLPEVTQTGFDFDGWYCGDIAYSEEDIISEDTLFSAEWIADMSIMTTERLEGTWKTTVKMMDVLEANEIKDLPTGFKSSAKLTGYFTFKDGKVTIFAVKKDLIKAADKYLEDLAKGLRNDDDLIYNIMMALYGLDSKKEVDDYISDNPPYFKFAWREAIIALVPDQDVEELLGKVLDSEDRYVLVKNAKYTVDSENNTITIGEDKITLGSVKDGSFKISEAEGKASGYKGCKLTKQ